MHEMSLEVRSLQLKFRYHNHPSYFLSKKSKYLLIGVQKYVTQVNCCLHPTCFIYWIDNHRQNENNKQEFVLNESYETKNCNIMIR